MLRRSTIDVAHASVTDHRITRRPAADSSPAQDRDLVAWHADTSDSAARNLALAWFAEAQKTKSAADVARARDLMSNLPEMPNDAEFIAAKGYLLLELNQPKQAAEEFRRAAQTEPKNADYWLDLGVAEQAENQSAEALRCFEKAIADDPYDYRPYLAEDRLYDQLGKPAQAHQAIERFLRLEPRSLTMELAE
jgi:tetratricopeptide (TPR) repeat protein